MSDWAVYRKRPVKIQARIATKVEQIHTLEGTMTADVGDYIIRGIHGELYPCKPDIFKATYDPVLDEDI